MSLIRFQGLRFGLSFSLGKLICFSICIAGLLFSDDIPIVANVVLGILFAVRGITLAEVVKDVLVHWAT